MVRARALAYMRHYARTRNCVRAHMRDYACTRTGDCVRGVNALLRGTATSAEPTARSGNGSAA
jgi:hypothetical protein